MTYFHRQNTSNSDAARKRNRNRNTLHRFESLENREMLAGDSFSWAPAESRGYVIEEGTTIGNGWETQGAGVAMVNLDDNPRLEMVSLFVDNPEGENRMHYRIGWNLNSEGIPTEWTPSETRGYPIEESTNSLGEETQGAGVTFAYLDDDPRPEMVAMFVEDGEFDNTMRYRIGWNIDADGMADGGWTPDVSRGFKVSEGPTRLGWETAGAGITTLNLDDNPMPELLTLFVDNPEGENVMHYRIGWNVDASGSATGGWSPDDQRGYVVPPGPDGLGEETQGAGVTVGNLDDDPRLEIIASYVNNREGTNSMQYRVGWNIDAKGIPTGGWTPGNDDGFAIPGSPIGWETQGAGLALADFNGDSQPDLVASFVDNPEFGNTFYYRIGEGQREPINFGLKLGGENQTLHDVRMLIGLEGFEESFRELDTFKETTIDELNRKTWPATIGETLRIVGSTNPDTVATDLVLAASDALFASDSGVELAEHNADIVLLESTTNDLAIFASGALEHVLSGDVDRNGVVNFADFLVLSANFGTKSDAEFSDGDFDHDGDIDFQDFLALSQNFGDSID